MPPGVPHPESPSDSEPPASQSVDTTLPSESHSAPATPQFEITQSPIPSRRTVDSTLPEPDEVHTHLLFTGPATERIARPIQMDIVVPDQVLVLSGHGNSTQDISERLADLTDAPIEHRELETPTDLEQLFLEAYEIVAEYLGSDNDREDRLSINLTAGTSLLELVFFTAVATYVLEEPSYRPSVDLYHVPAGEANKQSVNDLAEEEPEPNQVPGGPELLFEYLQRDLSDRHDQLENAWSTINERADSTLRVHQEISTALEQLQTAIMRLETEPRPQLVHELEDAVWLLADYADDLDGESVKLPTDAPPVTTFRNEIDRLETSVSHLRAIVRQHRRAFGGQRSRHTEAERPERVNSFDQPPTFELLETDGRDAHSGVYRIPIPLERKSQKSKEDEVQQRILQLLYDEGEFESISGLARKLADWVGTSYDESFRSKVQYNARTLAEKGYITRESHGRSYRVELSLLGAVWMQTHD